MTAREEVDVAHDVFVCHSSKDRTIANAVCSTLEQHRIRCWIAPRDVLPGRDYAEAIIEAISGSRLVVLVFSENSNQSPHVHREIERSVGHGIPILPFRVAEVVPSPSLEYFISTAHWLDAITPPLERHLDHLVRTVQVLLEHEQGGSAEAPAVVVPVEAVEAAVGATSSRPWWPWAAAAASVVAVVVAVAVLLGGGSGSRTAAPPSPSPSPSATASQLAPAALTGRLGATLTLRGMDAGVRADVTVLKVADPTSATESFDTPAPGQRFVAVQVRIRNAGSGVIDDAFDNCVTVVDRAGHGYEATTVYAVAAGPVFPATVTLQPGASTTGWTVLELPTGSAVAKVRFALDSGYADDVGEWTV